MCTFRLDVCNNVINYLPTCLHLSRHQGAHIKELIAELKEMFPTPDADDLQADFLEYRNTLRRKCTLRTCCSCGENHSLDDMVLDQSKKDAEALDFAGSSVFPPIAGFVFLQNPSGQSGLHICLRCFPDLKRGKRPHRAYHFGTPDPQLSCLNPHELRLVKPLVQVYQLGFAAFSSERVARFSTA